MVRRIEHQEPTDHDERLGEAIETYLALAEAGPAPEPEEFASRYPDLKGDLVAALEGLALVRGLVGDSGGHGAGPGSRLETGRRIAGYRIVRELGRGGMGVVYEAVHVGLDRPVALKVLGTHAAPDSSGRRRFLNEARTAAGLHHTHIVPVFDVGQVGGLCYYAMQRIEGSGLDRVIRHMRRDRATASGSTPVGGSTPLFSRLSLRLSPGTRGLWSPSRPSSSGSDSLTGSWPATELLSANESHGGGGLGAAPERDDDEPPPFDPPRGSAYYRWVAEVGREAAEALGHAHRRGVIHRDVKPSNLLVDGRGLVWVADFGLARRLADPSQTQHDSLLGTPRYMSPEQARVGAIDGRSDLFSLGGTLYELLTLRPPYEGRSAAELIEQIGTREPVPIRQTDPRVSRDLETIVLKLLSKRPADRYATAGELAEDLTRYLNHEPVHARRISPIGRLWRFAQRHPSLTAVSTAATVAILAVSTVAYVKVRNERDAAVQARGETQAAMRRQLALGASMVRFSNLPDRRTKGLGMIRDASAMKPEPELRSRLRDEAVEFLVMRDVEARPGFPTGRTRGLAFGPDGVRLAALTVGDDGEALGVWDVARREKLSERPLHADGAGGGRAAPRRGDGWMAGVPILASAGQCVATIAPDGQGVCLFDVATGAKLHDLKMRGHRVVGLFASPDGQRLVTVEVTSPPRPVGGSGRLPDGLSKGAPRPVISYAVNLWDPERLGEPLKTLIQAESEPAVRWPGAVLVAVSPDGKTVAVARGKRSAVSLFQAETGDALGEIDTQIELVALALGPDNQLATAGGGEIRLWDLDTRTPLPSLSPNQTVRFLRFSPRGSLLAVAGWGGRAVELWDTASHTLVAVLPTADGIDDLAFSPDGRTLAASPDGRAQTTAGRGETTSVWSVVESDVRVRLGGFDAMTRSMAFRADGLLAMGQFNGRVRFWSEGRCVRGGEPDAETETLPAATRDETPGRDRPASLTFDDRGRLITLESDSLQVCEDPPHCEAVTRVSLPGAPFPMSFPTLAPSRDGRTLVIGRSMPSRQPLQVLTWRSDQPGKLSEVTLPPGLEVPSRGRGRGRGRFEPPPAWRAIAVGPKGDRLYLIESVGGLHAWTVSGGKARSLSWPDLPEDATGLALSPDGGLLAVGRRSGDTVLINTETGRTRDVLHAPPGEGGLILSLAFSPDGKELAVGTQQGQIDLWSLADTTIPVLRLPGHRGLVTALAYDAQGHHLASAGSDKAVDVWDLDRIREEFSRLNLTW